jgi:HK97 family phage portal protein
LDTIFGGILNGIEISMFRNYETYLIAATKKVWALYKSCDIIGKVCMDTTGILSRKGGDGTAVKNAELDRLLTVPNEFETFGEMIYKWAFHMLVCGNSFWFKDQANFTGDRPKAIYQLNPKRVQVSVDARQGVVGYLYLNYNGEQIPFDVNEIMHFKLPHANNDYWGLGAVEAAEPLFNEAINREKWQEMFWKNGASPSGVMMLEDQVTDRQAWERAKADFKKKYAGLDNAGKTILITGKWSYQQLGLTAQEMQNVELAKWTVEQIFMQLGVPLSVAGVREAANYATSEKDDIRFRRYTIKPLLKFAEDTINSDLVAGFDPNLQFRFNVQGLIDIGNILQTFAPLFDRGVVSINEMRDVCGLPKVLDDPMFDQHFINAGLVPLELAGVASADQTQQAASAIIGRFIESGLMENKDLRRRLLNGKVT